MATTSSKLRPRRGQSDGVREGSGWLDGYLPIQEFRPFLPEAVARQRISPWTLHARDEYAGQLFLTPVTGEDAMELKKEGTQRGDGTQRRRQSGQDCIPQPTRQKE